MTPAISHESSAGRLADELGRCRDVMQRLLPTKGHAGGSLRVGLIYRESAGWAAQASFFHMFASSLNAVADESALEVGVVSQRGEDGVSRVPQRLPGQRWFMLPAAGGKTALEATVEYHKLHVVVDLFGVPKATPGAGILTWIPDFQSHRLPHLFTEQEHKDRHESYEQRAQVSQVILLSSHSAMVDCETFVPAAARLAEVIPFPSAQAFTPFEQDDDPAEVLRYYHLPAKFVLVANQYWAHKNHRVVLDALAIAASQGLRIPAVLTGLPSDYRDPANTPTSKLLQGIAELGLAGQVVPLGQVPFAHLVRLMRCAALVVQPSRFEGWSTVVQDIKALGRPLICSDISVHREQAPGALGFFGCDDPASLAVLFREHWDRIQPGPDRELERRGLASERVFAHKHGLRAAELCHKAFALACPGTGA